MKPAFLKGLLLLLLIVFKSNAQDLQVETTSLPAYCNGFEKGKLIASPQGGVPPYSIVWNDGATTMTNENLRPGSYTYTVTDSDNTAISGSGSVLSCIKWVDLYHVTISNGVITSTGNEWGEAGANSVNRLLPNENGYMVYTLTEGESNFAFGLDIFANSISNIENIKYGVMISDGRVFQVSNGTIRSELGSIEVGDKVKISRNNGVVSYLINNVNMYDEPITELGGLRIKLALSYYGQTIEKIESSFFRDKLTALSTDGPVTVDFPNSGYVSITASGGLEPYKYKWNNSSEESMISGLSTGDYRGVVKDDTGDSVVIVRSIGFGFQSGITKNVSLTTEGVAKIKEDELGNIASLNYIESTKSGWFEFTLKSDVNSLTAALEEFNSADGSPDALFTGYRAGATTLTANIPAQNSQAYNTLDILDASGYPNSIVVNKRRFVDATLSDEDAPTLDNEYGIIIENHNMYILAKGSTINKPINVVIGDNIRLGRNDNVFYVKVNGVTVFSSGIQNDKDLVFELNPIGGQFAYSNLFTSSQDVLPRGASCATNNKNWAYSVFYDGLGNVVSESRSFYDNLGRSTQNLTKNMSRNNVIATQTVYDAFGRGVLKTLPAPTFQTDLCYFENFINNQSNTTYGVNDFDVPNYSTLQYYLTPGEKDSPKPVHNTTQGSVGWYYSANNTAEPFVGTTGTPFSRVDYSPTDPGSIHKTSIAGDGVNHGSGHEMYSFTMKTAGELYYFLGYLNSWKIVDMDDHFNNYTSCRSMSDVKTEPKSNMDQSCLKSITLDQNGSESVSFSDAMGNLIGQCLSGSVNGQNQQLQSLVDYIDVTPGSLYPFIDVHLPKGCESSLWLEQPPSSQGVILYDIINIKTEQCAICSFNGNTPNLPPGYYRIKVIQKPASYVNKIKATYKTNYYNFTARFYDKANRLRIVVPPKGISSGGSGITTNAVSNGTIFKKFDLSSNYITTVQQLPNVEIHPAWYLINASNSPLDTEMELSLPNAVANTSQVHNFVVSFTGKSTGYSISFNGENNPVSEAYRSISEDHVFASGDMVAAKHTIDETDVAYVEKVPEHSLVYYDRYSNENPLLAMNPVYPGLPACLPAYSACNTTIMPVKISYQLFDQSYSAISGINVVTAYCTIVDCGTSYSRTWSFPPPNVHQIGNACNDATGNRVRLRILDVTVVKTPNYASVPFDYVKDITGYLSSTSGRSSGYPGHSMTEVFQYDSWSQLLRHKTPDSGTEDFVYDLDGTPRFTQNSKQDLNQVVASGQSGDKFSYVNIDEYGRSVQTGEYWTGLTVGSAQKVGFQNLTEYITNGGPPSGMLSVVNLAEGKANITETIRTKEKINIVYDIPDAGFLTETGINQPAIFTQDHVAGRISYTYNDERKSWYSYDELGRVKWVVQKYYNIPDGSLAYTIKSHYYNYDYLGNVMEAYYQYHIPSTSISDRLKQEFVYDADKRLIKTKSTIYATASPETKVDAEYSYYLHGPLKRKQLAGNLQGLDYVYTVNGWLKGINAPEMVDNNVNHDPGGDGDFIGFGKYSHYDVFGMTLDYFNGDYQRSSTNVQTYAWPTQGGSSPLADGYNGRIKAMRWQTKEPIPNSGMAYQNQQLMYAYSYDKKDQLTEAKFGYVNINHSHAAIGGSGPNVIFGDDYRVHSLTYDANGNIQTLVRNAYQAGANGLGMDNMTYYYLSCTNKLNYVTDAAINSSGPPDPYSTFGFRSGQASGNYSYDVLGEVTDDVSGDKYYSYNSMGKITSVKNAIGNPIVEYFYDESGQRYLKKSYSGSSVLNTFYARNPEGEVVGIYERAGTTGNYSSKEWIINSGGRIATAYLNAGKVTYVYEINDHLGSQRASFKQGVKQNFVTYLDAPLPDNMYLGDPNNTIVFLSLSGNYASSPYSPNKIEGMTSPKIPANPGDVMSASVWASFASSSAPSGAGLVIDLVDENNNVLATSLTNVSTYAIQIFGNLTNPSNAPASPKRYFRVYVKNPTTVQTNFMSLKFNITGTGGMPYPELVSVSNYYPHGSKMPGLNYVSSYGDRYGYQGQYAENDKEIDEQFFELRNYDPLLGRFKSVDPEDQYHSPYLAMGNNYPNAVDPNGGNAVTFGLGFLGGAVVGAIAGAVVWGIHDYFETGPGNRKLDHPEEEYWVAAGIGAVIVGTAAGSYYGTHWNYVHGRFVRSGRGVDGHWWGKPTHKYRPGLNIKKPKMPKMPEFHMPTIKIPEIHISGAFRLWNMVIWDIRINSEVSSNWRMNFPGRWGGIINPESKWRFSLFYRVWGKNPGHYNVWQGGAFHLLWGGYSWYYECPEDWKAFGGSSHWRE